MLFDTFWQIISCVSRDSFFYSLVVCGAVIKESLFITPWVKRGSWLNLSRPKRSRVCYIHCQLCGLDSWSNNHFYRATLQQTVVGKCLLDSMVSYTFNAAGYTKKSCGAMPLNLDSEFGSNLFCDLCFLFFSPIPKKCISCNIFECLEKRLLVNSSHKGLSANCCDETFLLFNLAYHEDALNLVGWKLVKLKSVF